MRELNETLEQRVQAETYERLQIWNVSQDLLVIADADGKLLNVNPAWTSTLGWPEAELIGKTMLWMLHPDDRENARVETKQLAAGHVTHRFLTRLRHRTGHIDGCHGRQLRQRLYLCEWRETSPN